MIRTAIAIFIFYLPPPLVSPLVIDPLLVCAKTMVPLQALPDAGHLKNTNLPVEPLPKHKCPIHMSISDLRHTIDV